MSQINKMKIKKSKSKTEQIQLLSPLSHAKITINKYYIDCEALNLGATNKKQNSLKDVRNPRKKSFSNDRALKQSLTQLSSKINNSHKIIINCLDENKPNKTNKTRELIQKESKEQLNVKYFSFINKNVENSPVPGLLNKDNYFNDQYKRPTQHSNSLKINKNDKIIFKIKQNIKEAPHPSKFLTNKKINKPMTLSGKIDKEKLEFTNLPESQKKIVAQINFDNISSKGDNKSQNNSEKGDDEKEKDLKIEMDNNNDSSFEEGNFDDKMIARSNFEQEDKKLENLIKINKNYNRNQNKKNNQNEKYHSGKTQNYLSRKYRKNSMQENKIPLLSEKIILSSVLSKPGINDEEEKINQDSYIIEENMFNQDFYLYGIFDGHGDNGHLISKYISTFISEFYNEKSNYEKIDDITPSKKPLIKIFLENYEKIIKMQKEKLDETIKSKIKFDISQSGSTSLLLFSIYETLICSNVGDSECYLFKCSNEDLWSYELLSKIHKPTDEIEKKRILENGGEIHPYYDENLMYEGPDRIYAKEKTYPGLSLSRTIGDLEGKKIGIISDPDITIKTIDESSKFIVMGSDGLWEAVKPYDVSRTVRSYFKKGDCDGASKALFKKAEQFYKKNNEERDDITIIVIFIGTPNNCLVNNKYISLKKIDEIENDGK